MARYRFSTLHKKNKNLFSNDKFLLPNFYCQTVTSSCRVDCHCDNPKNQEFLRYKESLCGAPNPIIAKKLTSHDYILCPLITTLWAQHLIDPAAPMTRHVITPVLSLPLLILRPLAPQPAKSNMTKKDTANRRPTLQALSPSSGSQSLPSHPPSNGQYLPNHHTIISLRSHLPWPASNNYNTHLSSFHFTFTSSATLSTPTHYRSSRVKRGRKKKLFSSPFPIFPISVHFPHLCCLFAQKSFSHFLSPPIYSIFLVKFCSVVFFSLEHGIGIEGELLFCGFHSMDNSWQQMKCSSTWPSQPSLTPPPPPLQLPSSSAYRNQVFHYLYFHWDGGRYDVSTFWRFKCEKGYWISGNVWAMFTWKWGDLFSWKMGCGKMILSI